MAGKGVQKEKGKGRGYDTTASAYPESSQNKSGGNAGQLTLEREEKAEPRRAGSAAVLTHEQIAERAKAIWTQRGCPAGEDERNWYEAESQLKSELGIQ